MKVDTSIQSIILPETLHIALTNIESDIGANVFIPPMKKCTTNLISLGTFNLLILLISQNVKIDQEN